LNECDVSSYIKDKLEDAVIASVGNIKFLDRGKKIFSSTDVSGSMSNKLSEKGFMTYEMVGLLMNNLFSLNQPINMMSLFGENFSTVNLTKKTPLQNIEALQTFAWKNNIGHATNAHLIFEYLNGKKERYDYVFIFTDCEIWNSTYWYSSDIFHKEWHKYKKANPDCKLYIFDLAGYETVPLSEREKDVFYISGWSDKIFDMIDAYENGSSALKTIKSIEVKE